MQLPHGVEDLNVQTERLDDHTARFTVAVEPEQLEKAKRVAASRIAKQVNIPGFRKGKAPYHILATYVGEAAILEDAVEVLGNQIYKDALDHADIEPYGPGSLEDFTVDPEPVFTFIVPLQPTVDLGDYRAVRLDYEAPTVEDAQVDEQISELRERLAVIEESHQPVASGNRVTLDLRGVVHHEAPHAEEEAEETAEAEAEADVESAEAEVEAHDEADGGHDHVIVDQEDMVFLLTEAREPVPGFSAALEGASVGDVREFSIDYPDDSEKYQNLAGETVQFRATVKKIETVTLPELNDEFAARATEDDETPLSLLELRMRIRKELQDNADNQAQAEYAERVLDLIRDGADVYYPEALISDQLDHIMTHVDQDLRQRGLTLDVYLSVTGQSIEDMREAQRENAIETVERSLVMRQLVIDEDLTVADDEIDQEIERIAAMFGDQADNFRRMYRQRQMRDNLRSELLNRALYARVAAIAKGEQPAVNETETITETDEPEGE